MDWEIERALATHELVRVEREEIDAEPVTGFVLDHGPELLLLHRLDDFDLAGYALLRLEDLTAVQADDVEEFTLRVLRDEGQLPYVGPPDPPVPTTSWGDAFRALEAARKIVIVESEDYEQEEFYIGRIVRVQDDAVVLHHFDAIGTWDEEPTAIRFADVTRVRFDERYTTVFEPYVGEPPG
ncbi:MAG TPA: hypothetical protein VFS40_00465 [Gemmatimonadales bacterium]|nr:hypothetical protein [Gemmatimonadales bacterium]